MTGYTSRSFYARARALHRRYVLWTRIQVLCMLGVPADRLARLYR